MAPYWTETEVGGTGLADPPTFTWEATDIFVLGVGGFHYPIHEMIGLGTEFTVGYASSSIEISSDPVAMMTALDYSAGTFGFMHGTLFLSIGF